MNLRQNRSDFGYQAVFRYQLCLREYPAIRAYQLVESLLVFHQLFRRPRVIPNPTTGHRAFSYSTTNLGDTDPHSHPPDDNLLLIKHVHDRLPIIRLQLGLFYRAQDDDQQGTFKSW